MDKNIEMNMDLMGMEPVKPKTGTPLIDKGPQINRSRTGRKLTDEEAAKRIEKRKKVKATKEKKLKTKAKLTLPPQMDADDEDQIIIPDIQDNDEIFDEDANDNTSEPVNQSDDEYIPETPATPATSKSAAPKPLERQWYDDPIDEPVVIKPIPKTGLSVDNPIQLHGMEPYAVIERLYGDIGYFILAEQMCPIKDRNLKLVQLKLDDGRFVNLFMNL